MMMILGMFVFMLKTAPYNSLQRNNTWKHPEQARIGQRPAYQYLGPGGDNITLSGTLMPEITLGRLSLDLIRAMAEEGKAWPLIEGSGRLYGFWAIEKVTETSSEFFRDGVPKKIEFSLDLIRVDERRLDMMGALTNAGLQAATGLLAGQISKVTGILN